MFNIEDIINGAQILPKSLKRMLLILKITRIVTDNSCKVGWIIRIYHECVGRIEKSFLRIAIWHHEACRVITNGDPEERISLSYPLTNNGLFFLLTTVFILFIYFK